MALLVNCRLSALYSAKSKMSAQNKNSCFDLPRFLDYKNEFVNKDLLDLTNHDNVGMECPSDTSKAKNKFSFQVGLSWVFKFSKYCTPAHYAEPTIGMGGGSGGTKYTYYPGLSVGVKRDFFNPDFSVHFNIHTFTKYTVSDIDSVLKYAYSPTNPDPICRSSTFHIFPDLMISKKLISIKKSTVSANLAAGLGQHFHVTKTDIRKRQEEYWAMFWFSSPEWFIISPGLEMFFSKSGIQVNLSYHFNSPLYSIQIRKSF